MFDINGVLVEFRTEPKEAKAASRKKGRPVYEDVDVIEIRNPHDQTVVIVRAATKADKVKYRKAWLAYQNEKDADNVKGTPLKEWRSVTRAQAREAAYFKVVTVEQLAEADEQVLAELGPEWYELKKNAAVYLAESEAGAEKTALSDENAQLRKQLEEMQRLVAQKDREAAPNDEEEKPKRGPGRPPKQEAEKE